MDLSWAEIVEGMAENGIYVNFTTTCRTCGGTVEYTNCQREEHPCPEDEPAVVIDGPCGGTWPDGGLVTIEDPALVLGDG